MFNKILVAIDQLPTDRAVFDHAMSIAKATNTSILLLHALSPFDQNYMTAIYPGVDGVYHDMREETVQVYLAEWKKIEQKGVEMLQALLEEARTAGITAEYTQNAGDAGRVICAIAQSWKADLIILGRRGRSGLSEFFLGSVSNYVLHHAPCSVLTVQGQPKPEITPESIEAVIST
jgi:nucleotide-binding universal stress UspA family protein